MNSANKFARVSGFLYVLANLPAPFALVYLPARLIVRGDPAATANNILASEALFRLGIVGNLFNSVVNIFLVLALYKLLKPVSKDMATLMVVLLLMSVPIWMLDELTQFAVLQLVKGADYLTAFSQANLQALALFFLDLHRYGIYIAQIFWGLWLFPLGYLVFKSGFLPRILGVLLIIGCCGYVLQSLGYFLVPNYTLNIQYVTGLSELFFVLWLLIKGVNIEQWNKRALELA